MELLDIYDNNGNKTGKVVNRETPDSYFSSDEHIAVSVIYIENSKNEFLVQKLSKYKGSMYTVPGGHIVHKEEPIDAIKREVKEELGVNIDNDNIIDLGFIVSDFPIRFIFYLKKDIDLNKIILQKEETDFVTYMNQDELKELIDKRLIHEVHSLALNKVLEYKKNNLI